MSYQCGWRSLLCLLFIGGLALTLGPAALEAQTAGGLPELHPISLIFTPSSPVDPTTTSVVVATAQVVNTGSAGAGPFRVQFSVCLQSQVVACSESNFSNFGVPNTLPGLGVGGQASVSGVLNLTNDIPRNFRGLLRIRVLVDPDNQVTELDEQNNEMTALLTIGPSPIPPPSATISAIAVDNRKTSGSNAVYVGTLNGVVSAFTFDSCTTQGCSTLIWQFNEPSGAIRAIAVDSSRGDSSSASHNVYVASDDGTVYALAAEPQPRTTQPTVLWRFRPNARSASPMLSLTLSRKTVGPPQGSPSGTQGDALLIYAGTQDGFIYAIRDNGTSGTQRWSFANTVARSGSSPAISALSVDKNNQFLYAGTANGVVYAIKPDADSFGQIQARWSSFSQNSQIGAVNVLAIDDFTTTTFVYAGSDDKSVYAFFGDSGQLNWQFSTDISSTQPGGAVKALGVDLQTTGALYVGTATDFVYGLPFLANNSGKARPSTDAKLCVTAQGSINAITVDPAPVSNFGAIALVASQDRNLYVVGTTVSGNNFQGCTLKTTLSSTSRQSPNISPIAAAGPLIAAPAIVTLTDTQLRATLFGATSALRFEVRYEGP